MRAWVAVSTLTSLLLASAPATATHLVLQDDAGSGADAPEHADEAFKVAPATVHQGTLSTVETRFALANPDELAATGTVDYLDVYQIEVDAGDVVEVHMAAFGGGAVAWLLLPGEEVDPNDWDGASLGSERVIQREAPADGVLVLAISTWAGGLSEYRFSVGIDEPAPNVASRPLGALTAGGDLVLETLPGEGSD